MHAATVDLLVEKAKLEPGVASAFGEAIDMALKEAQLVTVPILDVRFGALCAKVEQTTSSLEFKIGQTTSELLVRIEQTKSELEFKIEQTKSDLLVRMEQTKSELEFKIEQTKSDLLVRMEQIKADLVRWLFLVVLGNAAIAAVLNAIQRVH
jgi:hypothetical protein